MSSATDRRFAYQAVRSDGSLTSGDGFARDEPEFRTLLAARGLLPIHIRSIGQVPARKLAPEAAAVGLSLLARFITSGLSLMRGLQLLEELEPAGWPTSAIRVTRERVRDGLALADALEVSGVGLPEDLLAMIRAGEHSAGLAEGLRLASKVAEERAVQQRAFQSALSYPALLVLTGIAALGFLVAVVIPRFAGILIDLDVPLPFSTRLVLELASAAANAGVVIALVLIGAAGGWITYGRRNERLQFAFARLALALPAIGPLAQARATARAFVTTSALLRAGATLPTALRLGSAASGNRAFASRLTAAREAVVDGAPLAESLRVHRASTPLVIQFAAAGEQTGSLASMLEAASRIEAERGSETVLRWARLLEPSIILCVGAAIALVAAAMLQAVYAVGPTP